VLLINGTGRCSWYIFSVAGPTVWNSLCNRPSSMNVLSGTWKRTS